MCESLLVAQLRKRGIDAHDFYEPEDWSVGIHSVDGIALGGDDAEDSPVLLYLSGLRWVLWHVESDQRFVCPFPHQSLAVVPWVISKLNEIL